jgi:hypothetical protein
MVDRHHKTYSDTSRLWSVLLYAVIALLSISPTAHAQTSTPHTSNSSQLQLESTFEEAAARMTAISIIVHSYSLENKI